MCLNKFDFSMCSEKCKNMKDQIKAITACSYPFLNICIILSLLNCFWFLINVVLSQSIMFPVTNNILLPRSIKNGDEIFTQSPGQQSLNLGFPEIGTEEDHHNHVTLVYWNLRVVYCLLILNH